jgi:hypothetical protein
VEYFRDCWAGELSPEFFNNTAKAEGCWGVRPNYTECLDYTDTKCVGTYLHNYIYEIISGKKCFLCITISSFKRLKDTKPSAQSVLTHSP